MTEAAKVSTKEIVKSRLKKRYASEKAFRFFGVSMVGLAIFAAAVLLISIFVQATPAFTESRLVIKDYPLIASKVDPSNTRRELSIRSQGDFPGILMDVLLKRFPNAAKDGGKEVLGKLVTNIAFAPIAKEVGKNPNLIGTNIKADFALNDDLDVFFKGGYGKSEIIDIPVNMNVTNSANGLEFNAPSNNAYTQVITALKAQGEAAKAIAQKDIAIKEKKIEDVKKEQAGMSDKTSDAYVQKTLEISDLEGDVFKAKKLLEADAAKENNLTLNDKMPSVIIYSNGGAFKVKFASNSKMVADALVAPNSALNNIAANNAKVQIIKTGQSDRPINDQLIAYGTILKNEGYITQRPNITLLTHSDSNDPEMAGLLSAIVGSFMTLLVTFSITVPVGVFAAIYLEEFAPKNIFTDIIEVNINNLAAVPSIVFGLLGFSVFLHFFHMPRSAPIVGGIVLALMSLPVIIIASRAALKAVPPSIREAALGVGASKVQTVFHHVLPLALPGMMTGSILSMAHALGETAPLLMIGMVAFIADVPKGLTDAATVLPVEVFMWASRSERAWDTRTSAAIIILLLFMIFMNLIAIMLRRKFERRW